MSTGWDVPYPVNSCVRVEVGTGHIDIKYGLSRGLATRLAMLTSTKILSAFQPMLGKRCGASC